MRNNQQLKDEPAERRLASRIRIYIYIHLFSQSPTSAILYGNPRSSWLPLNKIISMEEI